MDIFIITIGWLFLGMIGSFLVAEFAFRRGSYPLDINVGDLIFFSFMSLFGLLNFIVGMGYLISWSVNKLIKSLGADTNKVIFKRRKN